MKCLFTGCFAKQRGRRTLASPYWLTLIKVEVDHHLAYIFLVQALQHSPWLVVSAGQSRQCGRTAVLCVRGPQWDPLQGRGRGHIQHTGLGDHRPGPSPGVHGPHQQQRLCQAVCKWR